MDLNFSLCLSFLRNGSILFENVDNIHKDSIANEKITIVGIVRSSINSRRKLFFSENHPVQIYLEKIRHIQIDNRDRFKKFRCWNLFNLSGKTLPWELLCRETISEDAGSIRFSVIFLSRRIHFTKFYSCTQAHFGLRMYTLIIFLLLNENWVFNVELFEFLDLLDETSRPYLLVLIHISDIFVHLLCTRKSDVLFE